MRVFLINLDRDRDRLLHMQAEAARAGLNVERIPATYGTALPDWAKAYFLASDGQIGSRLKPGEVGCYASHLTIARRIVEERIPLALVLEDDLELPGDISDLLASALENMPEDWDILRLSNPPKAPFLPCKSLTSGRELVVYSRVPNNTGAQMLSLSGAEKLLKPGLRTLAIDEELRRPWNLSLVTFGIVPAPIRSNIFDRSTIEEMGDRGLGRESTMAKFRRRHFGTPGEWFRMIRWQIATLGPGGWLKALLRAPGASRVRRALKKNPLAAARLRLPPRRGM